MVAYLHIVTAAALALSHSPAVSSSSNTSTIAFVISDDTLNAPVSNAQLPPEATSGSDVNDSEVARGGSWLALTEVLETHCALRLPMALLQQFLGLVGLTVNALALVVVSRDRDLGRPFKMVVSSLILADLSFAVACSLLASLSVINLFCLTQAPALATLCNVLNALYHSLLGCSATMTLAMSLDRVVAVFLPVRYRALSQTNGRWYSFSTVLPSWALASVVSLILPFTWHYLGDPHGVGQSHLSCWPLVAANQPFLVVQGVLLFVSALVTTAAYVCTFHKLTRRAILVVPFFGSRTSDTSAVERASTRRSAVHAASQAFGFCILHVPFAAYLVWLATARHLDRLTEACAVRFFLLSFFPAVNNILNPVLTLWRLKNCCWCWLKVCGLEIPASLPAELQASEPKAKHSHGDSLGHGEAATYCISHGSLGRDSKEEAVYYLHHAHASTSRGQEVPDFSQFLWAPPRNNYNVDNCRADPALLQLRHPTVKLESREVVSTTTTSSAKDTTTTTTTTKETTTSEEAAVPVRKKCSPRVRLNRVSDSSQLQKRQVGTEDDAVEGTST